MRQKPGTARPTAESHPSAPAEHYSAEEKIRIVVLRQPL